MPLLLLLSSLGLLVSAALHFPTYFGVDPQDHWPHFWLMYIAMIIPILAPYFIQKKYKTPENPTPDLKYLAPFAPFWMKFAVKLLTVYATLTIFLFIFRIRPSPTRLPDGTYGIQSHGQIYPLTEQEYHYQRALEVRCVAALWMIFFAYPIPALFSAAKSTS